MVKDYKDLRVWQQSMELVAQVYILTREMPSIEQFGLTSQIKRAAISIPSNIAEGQARASKQFLHFIRIAQGSLSELETQLMLCIKLDMLAETTVNEILTEIISIKKQLHSLSNKLKQAIN
ncbi:four helix bundle protein [Mesonia sediminis]|uniref:Four helix bundle protein n=2 Tax=Mesonia sediminis TaxID=1703946 RepID=A0ABW5SC57_9FLAO